MGLCFSNQTKSEEIDSSAPLTPFQSSHLRRFDYSDLLKATNKFGADSALGGGQSMSVFKGWIDDRSFKASRRGTGLTVAVMRLKLPCSQDDTEWLAEVDRLGSISHPNIVGLMGYCIEGENRLLVFDFMARGNLYNHLLKPNVSPLPWSCRLKIVLGAAKGLAFLHSDEVDMIYRNFKTSKVILDSDFNAKIFVPRIPRRDTSNMNHVRVLATGSSSYYVAPETSNTGYFNPCSDVYSFGVVLLEVLSGQSVAGKGQRKIVVKWAELWQRSDKRQLDELLDKSLIIGKYPLDGVHATAKLAMRCISKDMKSRPSMTEVVETLEALVQQNASSSTS